MDKVTLIKYEGAEYIRPCQISKMLNITDVTTWRYLKEMKSIQKYKHSFKILSWNKKLVNYEDFKEYLEYRNQINRGRGY